VLADTVTGSIVASDTTFLAGAAFTVRNSHLAAVEVSGGSVQPIDQGAAAIAIDAADRVQISNLLDEGAGPASFIQVRNALAGSIGNNVIVDSGFNASPPTGADTDPSWVGGIRLEGCTNVVVSGNSVTTPDAATYNGFGIITVDSIARGTSDAVTSKGNLVGTNIVNGAYDGASYRGQDRRINVAPGDTAMGNIDTAGN
jgi:hypothetical protein